MQRAGATCRPADQVDSEIVADDSELPALPSNEVAGGAAVLKLQAACGFLAFAELRLRATEPKSGTMGFDAGESGSLLHRVLQNFWREDGDARQPSLDESGRSATRYWRARSMRRCRAGCRCATDGTAHICGCRSSGCARCCNSGWKRSCAWAIHRLRCGAKELVTVGPLTLTFAWTVSTLVEGGMFFVDYKTGADVDPKQWAGPRPDDPQLPLYTLLAEAEELKGVAFAKVRAGREMKWHGYQAEEGILPSSRSKANVRDIASLAEEWRENADAARRGFCCRQGGCRPKSFEMNCARCAQRLLCRVDPSSLGESADERR